MLSKKNYIISSSLVGNNFQTLVVFLVLIGFLGFTSCNKIDKLFTFTIENESYITIGPSSPINLPFNIPTPNVTSNSSQQFENNNTDASHVKDIKLKEAKLTITNPTGKTFSFLKSIHVYISTNSSDEIELAYADNIVSSANNLTLTVSNEKLDPYIKASTFNLRSSIVLREVVANNVDIRLNTQFDVTATK